MLFNTDGAETPSAVPAIPPVTADSILRLLYCSSVSSSDLSEVKYEPNNEPIPVPANPYPSVFAPGVFSSVFFSELAEFTILSLIDDKSIFAFLSRSLLFDILIALLFFMQVKARSPISESNFCLAKSYSLELASFCSTFFNTL